MFLNSQGKKITVAEIKNRKETGHNSFNKIIEEKIQNRKLLEGKKSKSILEITEKNKNSFHKDLMNTKVVNNEDRKKFDGSNLDLIGKDENNNTYWKLEAIENQQVLFYRVSNFGCVTHFIKEDFSEYLEYEFLIGKDNIFYVYTPHEKDGVIIWKYTFDE